MERVSPLSCPWSRGVLALVESLPPTLVAVSADDISMVWCTFANLCESSLGLCAPRTMGPFEETGELDGKSVLLASISRCAWDGTVLS